MYTNACVHHVYVMCMSCVTYICIHMYYNYAYYTGASSVTDDDYGISYIITMVDVRSCTRPPRSPAQSHHHPGMYAYTHTYAYLCTSTVYLHNGVLSMYVHPCCIMYSRYC